MQCLTKHKLKVWATSDRFCAIVNVKQVKIDFQDYNSVKTILDETTFYLRPRLFEKKKNKYNSLGALH